MKQQTPYSAFYCDPKPYKVNSIHFQGCVAHLIRAFKDPETGAELYIVKFPLVGGTGLIRIVSGIKEMAPEEAYISLLTGNMRIDEKTLNQWEKEGKFDEKARSELL